MLTPRETLGIERRTRVRYFVVSLVAIVALLVTHGLIEAPFASARVATVPVVVAAHDVAVGATIDRVALKVAHWPAGTAPSGAYSSIDSVAGRVARLSIYIGQAIVPARLAPKAGEAR
jgi:pilus assembly protein CpaB